MSQQAASKKSVFGRKTKMAPTSPAITVSEKSSPFRKSPLSPKVKGRLSSKVSKSVNTHQIRSVGFPPYCIEAFEYVKDINGESNEAYSLPLRKIIEDEIEHPMADDVGFFACLYQRESISKNQRKQGHDNWPRYWMLRMVPGDNPSTPESRQEGANVLKRYFMDTNNTKYPPKDIDIIDDTHSDPNPMQYYLLDDDIMRVLQHAIDDDFFNTDFAKNYPDMALMAFTGPIFPDECVVKLGFNSLNQDDDKKDNGYTAGFHP